ncbi:RHO1 GDP-GTP exchange protein 2 [Entomophthora muscae]|uniref:RHO1 GDP-GTP exchange protein 2 n=1 Tax=Entomophthora muscae TaxID=34485 RepID=A0ACC2T7H5_9FUNG|nr:RHO1 GDP-GTP exchange protein 2 [Entomophthora muscae]
MYRSPTPQLTSRSPSPFLSSTPNEYRSNLDDPNSPEASYRRPLAIASRSSNSTRNYVPGNTVSPPALNMKLSPSGIRSQPLYAISTEPITRFVSSRNDSSRDYLSLSRVSNSPNTSSFTRTSPSSARAPTLLSPDHPRGYESSLNSSSFESSNYSQSREPSIYERAASPRPPRPLPQTPKHSYPSSSRSSINSGYSYSTRAPTPTPQKSTPVINSRFRAFSDVTPGHNSKPPLKLDKKLLEHNLEALGSQSELIPLSGALMSDVADRFLLIVPRQTHTKDSLEYQNSFTGKDIVDTICAILDTTDRKLALEYGRSLESQRLFHDVTFESILKDTPYEIFILRDFLNLTAATLDSSVFKDAEATTTGPSGVFINLTSCYTPTCTKDAKCYAPTCPHKLKHNYSSLRAGTHSKGTSLSSLPEPLRVWASTVPKSVLDKTPIKEKKRQEAIYEFIYTEKDFVEDIELLQENFIKPLQYEDIIPIERRDEFIEGVFFNISEIYSTNFMLSRDLVRRQESSFIVDQIGDLFLEHVQSFEPFVAYGAHQLFAKQCLDVEVGRNPSLAKFLEEREHLPELRKLPIQSFMGRPTTRLAKYSLLLDAIIKFTAEDHPDRVTLRKVIDILKGYLNRINIETGKADNKLKLSRLSHLIVGSPSELRLLNLLSEKRQLIRDGIVKKKTGVDQVELNIFLFDHLLLLSKKKPSKEGDGFMYKIHKKPIPLEMVKITIPDDITASAAAPRRASNGIVSRRANSLLSMGSANATELNFRSGFPIQITHLGRDGQSLTLYCNTIAERKQWKEKIEKQRSLLTAQSSVFEICTISDVFFKTNNRINCSAVFDQGRKILLGTEMGIYMGSSGGRQRYEKIMDLDRIAQIEVLDDYNMFIVLAEKTLYTFAMDSLTSPDLSVSKGRRISSHVSFFKVGICLGRCLVCVVKSTPLTSVVKALEPVLLTSGKKSSFGRFLMRAGKDGMRLFKKFYIPSGYTSLHFLKTKLCVGCAKGFEIVDLETLNTQGLLDDTDPSLNFILKREIVRPIAIFRVQSRDFLLCYDEFAFYVDKDGRRARLDFIIMWEGEPASFAYEYPYILGFNPDFIEIWHVETCKLAQVIPTGNSRSLCVTPGSLHCVSNPSLEYQHIFSLQLKKPAP